MSKARTLANFGGTDLATQAELDAKAEYNDDVIQTNLALLGFKVAVNGSLAKYNLQDQIVDEYAHASDTSGVDGTPSNNHILAGGAYSGITAATPPAGGDTVSSGVPSGYTVLRFDGSASESLTVVDSGNVSILVVAGGASGGARYGGGGGAGGLIYKATHAVTANTYDVVIGAGGVALTSASGSKGNNGVNTTFTINGGAVQFTAVGGGGGGSDGSGVGGNGGSGGGGSYQNGLGSETQSGQTGDSDIVAQGGYGYANDGGAGGGAPDYNVGGGGGAGSAGGDAVSANSGAGGTGYDGRTIFGTAVGDGGYFASGGGGAWISNGNSVAGTASSGGGTAGGTPSGGSSTAALANTGGGSGGGADGSPGTSGAGGSGVVLVRYANADFTSSYNDIILQSTDTAAETEADYADMVMLMEDTAGTATVNVDIKGFISEDSGVTFTEGVLVDEGAWGTNKRILAFHDLDISAQSGTAMCYKITTHNQAVGKQTKIHATSIGWR